MKTSSIKKIVIVLICSIGLYFSGNSLIQMSGVETLVDAFNVMTFFTCLFPFSFVSLDLLINSFRFFISFQYR